VHQAVFQWVLVLANSKKLLVGKSVAVDSTTLEADVAMKSIVRRDSGEDWQAYVISLMRSEGLLPDGKDPTDEEVRRFDKQRKGKKVSNEDWKSPTDPESKIAKMKDGTTHLAYNAEHVVDLDSGILLGAEVMSADKSDPASLEDSLHHAQTHLEAAGSDMEIQEVAADKGYHSTEVLNTLSDQTNYRTSFPNRRFRVEGTGVDTAANRGRRWSTIADEPEGRRAGSYSGCAVSRWRGRLPMCWRRAEADAVDSEGRRKSRSVTI
jgi:hypothetical protein